MWNTAQAQIIRGKIEAASSKFYVADLYLNIAEGKSIALQHSELRGV